MRHFSRRSHTGFVSRGFTVVELLVSVGIFVLLTVLLVVKYGSFNQSVLLTNLAYDVAVTIRTAQAYGLSVRKVGTGLAASDFQYAYGVHFDSSAGNDTSIVLFAFTPVNVSDHTYMDGNVSIADEQDITPYTLKRGARITGVCVDSTACVPVPDGALDIIFRRPNPNADICIISSAGPLCGRSHAEITITGTDGSTRVVGVRENGQIYVVNN